MRATPSASWVTGSQPNLFAPGKRPASNMAPVLVSGAGGVEAVLGTPGGPTIPTALANILLGTLVHGKDPEAVIAAGRLHHQGWPDALAHYRRALRLKPDYAAVHTNLGAVLAQTGHVDEGVAELRAAIRIDPGYPSAHEILGQILGGVGLEREGRAELEEAARLRSVAGAGGARAAP